ncbi:hypothetical protein LP422_05805 [Janibacter limosus]|uniref:Uncharacterized protein n=1 Tax=Janibacter limosus TaxID=53458 RepID=A0AC61U721_9MICO|nr:hypothetical protein [Janibacter limosus]UUZ45591.1 hypothetical protein LP422_05805 [Janibacter limosus]
MKVLLSFHIYMKHATGYVEPMKDVAGLLVRLDLNCRYPPATVEPVRQTLHPARMAPCRRQDHDVLRVVADVIEGGEVDAFSHGQTPR